MFMFMSSLSCFVIIVILKKNYKKNDVTGYHRLSQANYKMFKNRIDSYQVVNGHRVSIAVIKCHTSSKFG